MAPVVRRDARRRLSSLPQETLPGGGAGEDKEREGKGRDACRGPGRDASFGKRSGVCTALSESSKENSDGPAISTKLYYGEFDSGSERTLAAWIRHASRTEHFGVEWRTGE